MNKLTLVFSAILVVFFLSACSKEEFDYNPVLNFTMNPVYGMTPCEVSFSMDLLPGETCEWDFGDGSTSRDQNPIHTYLWPGEYKPLMIAYKKGRPQYLKFHSLNIDGPLFEYRGSGATEKTIKAVANGFSVHKIFYEDYSNPVSNKQYEVRSEYSKFYFVGGYEASGDSSTRDMYCSLLDIAGNPVWEKSSGFQGDDAINAVAVIKNYLYAAGYRQDATGKYIAVLLCLDVQGNTLFEKTFAGEKSQVFNGMSFCSWEQPNYPDDEYSDFLLTGYTITQKGDKDVLAMLVDDSGNLIWEKTLGTALDEEGLAVYMQNWYSGFITGYQCTQDKGKDILVARVADSEVLCGFSTYGGEKDDIGKAITKTYFGQGFIVAGSTESYGAGGVDMYLAEFTQWGVWVKSTTFGTAADEEALAVDRHKIRSGLGSTSCYVITGNRSNNSVGTTPVVITTTTDLKMNWEKSYSNEQSTRFLSGVSTVDRGILLGGVSGNHLYLLRTDGNGNY